MFPTWRRQPYTIPAWTINMGGALCPNLHWRVGNSIEWGNWLIILRTTFKSYNLERGKPRIRWSLDMKQELSTRNNMEWSHIRKIKNHFYQQRVTKFPLCFSYVYTKISRFKKGSHRKITSRSFYPLVSKFEKLSTWVLRLPQTWFQIPYHFPLKRETEERILLD